MSSSVGPSPPVTSTTSARSHASRSTELDAFGVVPHDLVVEHVDADLGEPLPHPLGVRVGDLTQEQLGADADELGPHGGAHGRRRDAAGLAEVGRG